MGSSVHRRVLRRVSPPMLLGHAHQDMRAASATSSTLAGSLRSRARRRSSFGGRHSMPTSLTTSGMCVRSHPVPSHPAGLTSRLPTATPPLEHRHQRRRGRVARQERRRALVNHRIARHENLYVAAGHGAPLSRFSASKACGWRRFCSPPFRTVCRPQFCMLISPAPRPFAVPSDASVHAGLGVRRPPSLGLTPSFVSRIGAHVRPTRSKHDPNAPEPVMNHLTAFFFGTFVQLERLSLRINRVAKRKGSGCASVRCERYPALGFATANRQFYPSALALVFPVPRECIADAFYSLHLSSSIRGTRLGYEHQLVLQPPSTRPRSVSRYRPHQVDHALRPPRARPRSKDWLGVAGAAELDDRVGGRGGTGRVDEGVDEGGERRGGNGSSLLHRHWQIQTSPAQTCRY